MNRDFLKEAIADAKAVKESAIANAKVALEEAFTPHIKSMLAAKLEEMDNEDSNPVETYESETGDEDIDVNIDGDEEMSLDELLAELEGELENEPKELNEVEEEETEETEEEEETEDENGEDETEEETEDDLDLDDMTEDDLKKFIESVIGDMVKAGELTPGENEEASEDDENLDIEIEDDEEEFPAEELAEKTQPQMFSENKTTFIKMKRELNEAYSVIITLKSELNEINLLNAKLLYTNKIFKSKTLTENQKVKVLNAFDKATSTKEVKLVYETLSEGLKSTIKKSMNENLLGSASKSIIKPLASKPIIEENEMVKRFQKLAGII